VEVDPFLRNVHEELDAAAGGTEAEVSAAGRLARALDPALRLALLDAVGRVAMELSERIPGGRVEVRLAGRDVELVYVAEESARPAPGEEGDDGGETARITFRVPGSLKSRIESEASREGISTNAWLVHAVTRALSVPQRRTGQRITGFAQS
jgi:hypothetical protein